MSLHPDFINELRKRFRGDIRLDHASRVRYSTDASIYQIEPMGVALPRTQEDLIAAVELAAKYKIPILPRGAGTSLAGQAIGNALILDCSRWLDHIVEINADQRYAVVEPGVVQRRRSADLHLSQQYDPASGSNRELEHCRLPALRGMFRRHAAGWESYILLRVQQPRSNLPACAARQRPSVRFDRWMRQCCSGR